MKGEKNLVERKWGGKRIERWKDLLGENGEERRRRKGDIRREIER